MAVITIQNTINILVTPDAYLTLTECGILVNTFTHDIRFKLYLLIMDNRM